jgi:hypothetical protein
LESEDHALLVQQQSEDDSLAMVREMADLQDNDYQYEDGLVTHKDINKMACITSMLIRYCQILNYLRSSLQGPALNAISGITLTDANYREAVDVLKERFGNKKQIIDKHMDALLSVEVVTSDNNLRGTKATVRCR